MTDETCCALVVDDEPNMRELLTMVLEKEKIKVVTADNGQQALQMIQSVLPDAIILDVYMPGLNGIEVLGKIREIDDDLPVVFITGHTSLHQAVEATKSGAYDYIAKPFDNNEIVRVARRALSEGRLKKKLRALRGEKKCAATLIQAMGPSDKVAHLAVDVHRVAKSDFSVVIVGETGSGKELVARAIHGDSARRDGIFVAVDCGAIPEPLLESELFGHEKGAFTGADRQKLGKFELANGGTLFMDEIANLPLGSQAKLLRVIQDRLLFRVGGTKPVEVDVRILTATHSDLAELMASGLFRSDLYYRLSEFTMQLPSLRERVDDIPYLAKKFLDMVNIELEKSISGFTEGAVDAIMSYGWPGNVRQLRSVIRRAALLAGEVITEKDLGIAQALIHELKPLTKIAAASWESQSLGEIVRQSVSAVERAVIAEVLAFTGGNKAKAARLLKVDYKTLHTKVIKFGIQIKGGGDGKA